MGQVLQIGVRAFTKCSRLSLQSGSIIIAKCGRYYSVGKLYCKVGQLSQKRPVHLCDTRTNRDLCLLTEQMYFKNRVLYDVMHGSDGSDPLRKIHVFARAHTIYDAFNFTGTPSVDTRGCLNVYKTYIKSRRRSIGVL